MFKELHQKLFFRVPLEEKMLFTKHLSIMIKSGMPLLDSLWLLRKQANSKVFKKILNQIAIDIDNGQFLSVGLERYLSVFGDFFINVIRVGEASGTLAENLNYLHEEIRKNYELRRKVKGAMIYPVIILFATFGIGGLLMFFVFPKIIPIFTSLRVELPFMTRALIQVINILTSYGIYIAMGFIFLVFSFFALLQVPSIRFIWHRILLVLPFVGNVSVNINITSFARTLASLLKSGIKIVDAVLITSDTMPNLVYKSELKKIAENIKAGESISDYIIKKEKIFPPIFSQMIQVGESTGHLDENLVYLANFYEAEVDEVFKNLSTILEPVLLLIMGVIVGFVAIAIITPIYGITKNLKIR